MTVRSLTAAQPIQRFERLRPRAAGLRARRELVTDQLVRAGGPVAQEWPGVARVDDLLDREALRGAERRADGVQPRLDLPSQGHGIVGGLEVAPVGGLQPTRYRKRSPVAGGPRVAQVEARAGAVAGAGHPVDLSHQDRDPWHGCLVHGIERPGPAADRPGSLAPVPIRNPGWSTKFATGRWN